jgi:hypothetical protein
MKTIFDLDTREELIQRIHSLQENSAARWGKMNAYQAIQHCILWDEMILQNKKFSRSFIGLLLGKMIMKKELREGSMIQRNAPTTPELVIKESSGDITTAKNNWITLIRSYEQYQLPDFSFVHAFLER